MLNTDTWGDAATVDSAHAINANLPPALRGFAIARSQAREAAVQSAARQAAEAENLAWAARLDSELGDMHGPEYEAAVAELEAATRNLDQVTAALERTRAKLRKREEAAALQLADVEIGDLERAADKQRDPSGELAAMRAIVAELERRRQAAASIVDASRRQLAFLATRGLHARANEIADSALQAIESAVAAFEEGRKIERLIVERGGVTYSRLQSSYFEQLKGYCERKRAEAATWPARGME